MNMTERYGGEEKQEIALWFVIHTVPYGSAPYYIKEQWLDVSLPLRKNHIFNPEDELAGYVVGMNIDNPEDVVVRTPEESVVVDALDAFKALRLADKTEAAEWWEEWFGGRHFLMGTELRFQTSEGRILTPAEIKEEYPDANRFDELEV